MDNTTFVLWIIAVVLLAAVAPGLFLLLLLGLVAYTAYKFCTDESRTGGNDGEPPLAL